MSVPPAAKEGVNNNQFQLNWLTENGILDNLLDFRMFINFLIAIEQAYVEATSGTSFRIPCSSDFFIGQGEYPEHLSTHRGPRSLF